MCNNCVNAGKSPVGGILLHCAGGMHRTGIIYALIRRHVNDDPIEVFLTFSFFNLRFKNLVRILGIVGEIVWCTGSVWFLPRFKNMARILELLAPHDFPYYPGFYPGFKTSVFLTCTWL